MTSALLTEWLESTLPLQTIAIPRARPPAKAPSRYRTWIFPQHLLEHCRGRGKFSRADCEARLENFCRTYWQPGYAFNLRMRATAEDARDLTSEPRKRRDSTRFIHYNYLDKPLCRGQL